VPVLAALHATSAAGRLAVWEIGKLLFYILEFRVTRNEVERSDFTELG
jgi:hypothetical protein